MHICHIAHNYYPGVSLAAMYEFTQQEALQGCQVSVIALGRGTVPQVDRDENGVVVYRFPSETMSAGSKRKVQFIRYAARLLQEIDCDVVHVYANWGLGLLPLLAGKKRKSAAWIYDLRSGPIRSGWKRYLTIGMLRLEAAQFDATASHCEGTRDSVFGKHRGDIAILSMGVNLERFRRVPAPEIREQYGIRPDEKLLIFSGFFHPSRRLERLIEAVAEVAQAGKCKIKVMMLGDGPDHTRLTELAHSLGLEEVMIFPGRVEYTDVPRYLSAADIGLAYVVNNAEYGVMPALKTAEMLSCELPIVASNTYGNRMFVKDGYNGLIVEDHPKAIAEGILRLIEDDGLRQSLAAAARPSITDYGYDRIVANAVIPFYKDLLNRVQRKRHVYQK